MLTTLKGTHRPILLFCTIDPIESWIRALKLAKCQFSKRVVRLLKYETTSMKKPFDAFIGFLLDRGLIADNS